MSTWSPYGRNYLARYGDQIGRRRDEVTTPALSLDLASNHGGSSA